MDLLTELFNSRAKEAEAYVQRSTGAKLILTIAGEVRLNIESSAPIDQAAVIVTEKEVSVTPELLKNPHATIKGKKAVLKDLIASTKENEMSKGTKSFEDAEKRGDVSIESHGIKGRLIVSRVRKMLFN